MFYSQDTWARTDYRHIKAHNMSCGDGNLLLHIKVGPAVIEMIIGHHLFFFSHFVTSNGKSKANFRIWEDRESDIMRESARNFY